MSILQTLQSTTASAKVVASIVSTLTVLIGTAFLLDGRFAHAEKTEAGFADLQIAMDTTSTAIKLDVQQMYLDTKVDRSADRINELEDKRLEKGTLDNWEQERLNRLREQLNRDELKIEHIEQFRLEHKM